MACIVGVDPGIRGGVSLVIGEPDKVTMAQVVPMPLARVMIRKGASKDKLS